MLVDDNTAVRTILNVLIEEHADVQVVGEASDGEEGVVLAERYRPDVTLTDIRLPRVSGVEATRRINKKLPDAVEVLYKTFAFAMYTYYPTRQQQRIDSMP